MHTLTLLPSFMKNTHLLACFVLHVLPCVSVACKADLACLAKQQEITAEEKKVGSGGVRGSGSDYNYYTFSALRSCKGTVSLNTGCSSADEH